jgi:TolB protein
VHSVFEGKREVVARFKGINGAPVWSPDGRKLALTSSHKGNPDIYLLDLSTKKLQQLTHNWAIDTEPAWMPNGKAIVFTSGRSGNPQLYYLELNSGSARRLTFEGKYNTSAAISPDGKTIAMVHGEKGKYQIAALDIKTGLFRVLTDGRLDESPSFAPNGTIVIYATEQRGRGVLAAVSIGGRTRQRLAFADGNIREPTWGPFLKKRTINY